MHFRIAHSAAASSSSVVEYLDSVSEHQRELASTRMVSVALEKGVSHPVLHGCIDVESSVESRIEVG